MFVGAFADSSGRRPAYMFCFTVYIAANIGCALAPNYTALLILRMLQSAGSSTTVALAQAVVADIVTSAERGRYVSYMSLPIMLAPALGPVLGGALAEYLGWRWTFWILTILCGVVAVAHVLSMPETCRGIVGDGSVRPKHLVHRSLWQVGRELMSRRRTTRREQAASQQPRPEPDNGELHMTTTTPSSSPAAAPAQKPTTVTKRKFNAFRALLLLVQPSMALLLTYSSLVFANFYCLMTSIPAQFNNPATYHLNDLQTGLIYLPLGVGTLVGAQITGRLQDWNFKRHCALRGLPYEKKKQLDLSTFPLETARLQVGIPALCLATCVVLVWGWVLEARTHIAVPCVLLFLAGVGLVGFTNSISVVIVDMNPGDAGAATAANNFTRCLVGAAASAAIQPMI
ncbi:major facilitator superfamily domain-containing protein, partial [Microdochium bolleyi]